MASYKGINASLVALENFFKNRLPIELSAGPINASVSLLGSSDISNPLNANRLGVYLHRITIDPHGRSRFFQSQGTSANAPRPELPVNLHFLLIATATSATIEADLMSWAMVELANNSQLNVAHLSDIDTTWGESEILTMTPEEMSTEDLMRIWDVFDNSYTNSVPYIGRTVRMKLNNHETLNPDVLTRVYPTGTI